jgi:hypothetical protein
MKTKRWYRYHIYSPLVRGEAADDTEAAVNVIIRALFGEGMG